MQVGLLVALLAAVHRPLGGYLAHVFASDRDARIERGTYRLLGVGSQADQTWSTYAGSVLAFSAVSLIMLYLLQRLQARLPLVQFAGLDVIKELGTNGGGFYTSTPRIPSRTPTACRTSSRSSCCWSSRSR